MFGQWGRALGMRAGTGTSFEHVTTDTLAEAAGLTVRHSAASAVAASQNRANRPLAPAEYTWSHRAAGWLSPGITGLLDVTAGLLVPYGADAARVSGGRIIDRFFMLGARFRGFDSIGPKAAPVPGGTKAGDVLGGDYLMAATARVLLPPPLPSVRLANVGFRSQLWATAGVLAARGDTPGIESFASQARGSAGVGLFLPLMSGIALEANYALLHGAQPNDVVATLRLQLGS
jgi:outer membrane protein assembly factor BamA